MAAGAGALQGLSNALHAETLACMKALELATSLGMQRIIIELDAQNLVSALMSDTYDRSELGACFKEIRSKIACDFVYCDVSKCSRNCNAVADCLSDYGASLSDVQSKLWIDQAPNFVIPLVSGDVPVSEC